MKKFRQENRISLKHYGDCHILAVSDAGRIYAEEFYDESYVAQHEIMANGELIQTADENFGKQKFTPF